MVIWLIGLSGAGKTTVGQLLTKQLAATGRPVLFLDGDELRAVWHDDLDFTLESRRLNHTRISRLSALLDQSDDIDVVVAALSIFPDLRAWNRQNIERYFEVFLDVPLSEAVRRDKKCIYARAKRGEIKDVVGLDLPFPAPTQADLVIGQPLILDPPSAIARTIVNRITEVRRHG